MSNDDDEIAGEYYTVRRGDTLGKIAEQFYGDSSLYNVIFDINSDQLDDPNKIEVGQELFIPYLEEDEGEEEEEEEYEEEDGEEAEEEDGEEVAGGYYVVQRGDTLGKIAKHFYGDAALYTVIFEANSDQLDDPNKIEVGQELFIPDLEESGGEGCSS